MTSCPLCPARRLLRSWKDQDAAREQQIYSWPMSGGMCIADPTIRAMSEKCPIRRLESSPARRNAAAYLFPEIKSPAENDFNAAVIRLKVRRGGALECVPRSLIGPVESLARIRERCAEGRPGLISRLLQFLQSCFSFGRLCLHLFDSSIELSAFCGSSTPMLSSPICEILCTPRGQPALPEPVRALGYRWSNFVMSSPSLHDLPQPARNADASLSDMCRAQLGLRRAQGLPR
jgi:hypothetical protein